MNENKKFVEDNYQLIKYIGVQVAGNTSAEDREDLVNDTVVRLLHTSVVANQDGASSLITRVMTNLYKNSLRDGQTDAMGHTDLSMDEPLNNSEEKDITLHDVTAGSYLEDVEREVKEHEHYSQVYKGDIEMLCQYLPDKQARLFKMRYYLGMTPTEIAEDIGAEQRSVETTLHRAVKNAHKLCSTQKPDNSRYDGLTIREMALAELQEDSVLYPFILYYQGSKSLINIAHVTGRSINSVKRAISIGEKMLYIRYGFDIKNRILK